MKNNKGKRQSEIYRLLGEGLSQSQVAKKMGCGNSTIAYYAKKLKEGTAPISPAGEEMSIERPQKLGKTGGLKRENEMLRFQNEKLLQFAACQIMKMTLDEMMAMGGAA